MSETFNGWIIIPRDTYEVHKQQLAPYIILEREYGKAIDVSVRNLPMDIYNFICFEIGHGIIHGCK